MANLYQDIHDFILTQDICDSALETHYTFDSVENSFDTIDITFDWFYLYRRKTIRISISYHLFAYSEITNFAWDRNHILTFHDNAYPTDGGGEDPTTISFKFGLRFYDDAYFSDNEIFKDYYLNSSDTPTIEDVASLYPQFVFSDDFEVIEESSRFLAKVLYKDIPDTVESVDSISLSVGLTINNSCNVEDSILYSSGLDRVISDHVIAEESIYLFVGHLVKSHVWASDLDNFIYELSIFRDIEDSVGITEESKFLSIFKILDSISIVDNNYLNVGIYNSDDISIVDSNLFSVGIYNDDYLEIGDSKDYTHGIFYTEDISDSIDATDNIFLFVGILQSDTSTTSDSNILDVGLHLSNYTEISESIIVAGNIDVNLQSSVSISDVFNRKLEYYRDLSDSIILLDSVFVDYSFKIDDLVDITDIGLEKDTYVYIDRSVELSDTEVLSVGLYNTDSINVEDLFIGEGDISTLFEDSFYIIDNINLFSDYYRDIYDTIDGVDQFSISFYLVLEDIITTSDIDIEKDVYVYLDRDVEINDYVGSTIYLDLTDSISVVDVITKYVHLFIEDIIELSDILYYEGDILEFIQSYVEVTDNIVLKSEYYRDIEDIVEIEDVISKLYSPYISDIVELSDIDIEKDFYIYIDRDVSILENISIHASDYIEEYLEDFISVDDSISLYISIKVEDITELEDSNYIVYNLEIFDTLGIVDDIYKYCNIVFEDYVDVGSLANITLDQYITQTCEDVVTIDDSISLSVGLVISDSIDTDDDLYILSCLKLQSSSITDDLIKIYFNLNADTPIIIEDDIFKKSDVFLDCDDYVEVEDDLSSSGNCYYEIEDFIEVEDGIYYRRGILLEDEVSITDLIYLNIQLSTLDVCYITDGFSYIDSDDIIISLSDAVNIYDVIIKDVTVLFTSACGVEDECILQYNLNLYEECSSEPNFSFKFCKYFDDGVIVIDSIIDIDCKASPKYEFDDNVIIDDEICNKYRIVINSILNIISIFGSCSINLNFNDNIDTLDYCLLPQDTDQQDDTDGVCSGGLEEIMIAIPEVNMKSEFGTKLYQFFNDNKDAIMCLILKYLNEETIKGKSKSQFAAFQYYLNFQLVASMYLEMKWNPQDWKYYYNKYNIKEARKFSSCYNIDFDSILELFDINKATKYQIFSNVKYSTSTTKKYELDVKELEDDVIICHSNIEDNEYN